MRITEKVRALLNAKPTKKNMLLLFFMAFLLRSAIFFFYIQYNERYNQADTADYHNCAVSMATGQGMYVNGYPRFWRAPGYPFYLHLFYNLFGVKSRTFNDNHSAQMAALWIQIALCSLLPIIIFYLALMLTGVLSIAWISAWIAVFHLGFVLSSTFLMTDGLGTLLFYLFLIFFYSSFAVIGEKVCTGSLWWISLASFTLGILTYIRPMGNYVFVVSLLLLAVLAKGVWSEKIKKMFLFALIFLGLIGGWYVRNYHLTGKIFFCPMFGLYLNTFVAPKIAVRINGGTLEENWKQQQRWGHQETIKVAQSLRGSGYLVVPEIEYGRAAWPLILSHPLWAFQDWMQQVLKTTVDMFSSQHLVALARGDYCEPLEEFLSDKIKDVLYRQPMSLFMRLLCWLELLFTILIWIGLSFGFFLFMVVPLVKCFCVEGYYKRIALLWLKTAPFIGAVVFMTGGYGYARLRLPVDLLMIILSFSFWYWAVKKKV
ncbi:hypothetical protein E3J79_04085 [Candidatus Dependentiae bacterium]|nr:MAG: hypothetical protein E3J79_04085 [Candidatus Dependentiae bacterium]